MAPQLLSSSPKSRRTRACRWVNDAKAQGDHLVSFSELKIDEDADGTVAHIII